MDSSPSPSSQISRKSARKSPHKRVISTPIKKPSMHPRQLYKENYRSEKASLKLKEALTRIDKLEAKVSNLKNQLKAKEATISKLSSVLDYKDDIIKKKSFTFDELQRKPTLFKYLCGLTVDQFNLLWKCIEPYVFLIVYDESASDNKVNARLMDQKSELLTVLTCCQHGLDLGVSDWMSGISEPSMSRLYSSWIVFLASMFNCIDLKPAPAFLQFYDA